MSTISTSGKVALVRFENGGLRTDHFRSLEDMLGELLMNSGDKVPFLVRDKLLPPAIAAWERAIKQDNCEHTFNESGYCNSCELEMY